MIESLQNPKIKLARSLQRRRVRLREGKLFIEGLRLVEDALSCGIEAEQLFFTASALENARVERLISHFHQQAWLVADHLMKEISQTVTSQGIAAIVCQPALPWPSEATFLLVVDRLRDPGNLGTLIRTAAAAGVEGLIVPKGSVDPWRNKVLRAAMGAHFRLPILDGLTWPEILPLLNGLTVRLADAKGSLAYDEADWSLPSGLIIGGEADGVGDEALSRADEIISIPMAHAVESLNAAVAGGVIMFEALRQRRKRN